MKNILSSFNLTHILPLIRAFYNFYDILIFLAIINVLKNILDPNMSYIFCIKINPKLRAQEKNSYFLISQYNS